MTENLKTDQADLRILLVDDEEDFVETLADSLSLSGYTVATAGDAAEALARREEFAPEIALVDIRLGQDDGIELVSRFREIDPDLVCVMATAYSDAQSAIRALQSGAYDYLSKPFHVDELLAVINRCAERRQLVRANQETMRALTEREEHFRTIFHTAPDAMALLKAPALVFDDVNENALKLFNLERDQVVGKSPDEFGLWQDQVKRNEFYRALDDFGVISNIEAQLKTSTGEDLICLVSASTIYFQDDMYYILAAKDITDISMVNKALRESELRYRKLSQQFETLLDGITDALLLMSDDCKVIWGNRGAADQFGRSAEELPGLGCRDLWNEKGEHCENCIHDVVSTGKPKEMLQKMESGSIWGVKSYPIKNAEGRTESVIQIISDLTEKSRLREEAARQSHLAALGELAAGVAHEINNPTGMIMRSMPMIRDAIRDAGPILDRYFEKQGDFNYAGLPYSEMKEQVTTLVGDVQDCAQRIKRIVDDLKDFSRPHGDGQAESFDLAETIEKAGRLMHNLIKNSTDHFSCEIESPLPPVRGQAQRVEQVVLNLIQNACHALQSRNEAIAVRVFHDADKNMNVIEVRDEGMGIEPEILEHIQEPFYTTRREEGGSGLGLSVSSRIIADHDGRLEIESTPGAGSLFRVILPTGKS